MEVATPIERADEVEPPEGGVTGLAEKDVETPAGAPESDRVTAELNPFNDVTVMVELAELPCWIDRELGDAEREKSGEGDVPGV